MSTPVVSGGVTITHKKRRTEPLYYLFLFPTLILLTIAITLPGVVGIFFSITNYIGVGEWNFVGFTNYAALLSDPAIRQAYILRSESRWQR